MDKLMSTSKKVDSFLKFAFGFLSIFGAAAVIILGYYSIKLTVLGSYSAEVTGVALGNVDFTFAQPIILDHAFEAVETITVMVAAVITIVATCYIIRILRNILKPMMQGTPFDGSVSKEIRKLGIAVIVAGLVTDIAESIGNTVILMRTGLLDVVISEKVSNVMVSSSIDADAILVGILVILLSYVFRHGEELQQQADETL